MPANNSEQLERRVRETASRLRLIQVDFADESRQTRTDYLCEEVERALKTVLPDERNEFLERLMAKFPTGTAGTQPVLTEPQAESGSAIEANKLKSADFLLRHLVELAPSLSGDERESVIKGLRQAGLASQAPLKYASESVQELKAKLQLRDEPSFDADRLTDLTVLLAEFACKLEPLVWNTWRNLSPRSSVRPPGALKTTMGQFICGGPEASRAQADNALKELQRLIAAIVTAVSRVGSQFAKHHLAKFSPSEISALVRMEAGSVFVSHEVKCWRKYRELADTLTEDSLETEIRKAIVDYVESLVKGRDR